MVFDGSEEEEEKKLQKHDKALAHIDRFIHVETRKVHLVMKC